MSRPIAQIAEFIGCSEETAREFCVEVQHAIRRAPPSFKVIAKFIIDSKQENLKPDVIARALNEVGWETNAERKRARRGKGRQGGVRNFKLWDLPEPGKGQSPSVREVGVEARSVLDKKRAPLHSAKKCPHGVPAPRICAICDPEIFREMTGID